MKKVALVLNSAWQAYNFRLNLARSLKRNHFDVLFIAPHDEQYSKKIQEEFLVIDLQMNSMGINPFEDIKTMKSLFYIFKEYKPDVILNFTIKPNIYAPIIGKFFGLKAINNITGLGTLFIKESLVTKVVKLLYKLSFSCTDKVFFQNQDDRELFVKCRLVNHNKTFLIPGSGVDVERFKPKQSDKKNQEFTFLMISRVLKDKGIYEYIEAIKILQSKYNNLKFQLLGEVGAHNKTAISKAQVDRWIAEGFIEYLGTTDTVELYIAEADCIVLPSYREGTPRSLLEAASMAKPIVTTNVVGCKEVVDDGENGFLCEARNSFDLASKLEKIFLLPLEERVLMGEKGRKKIEDNFNENIVIDRYIKAIQEVLK